MNKLNYKCVFACDIDKDCRKTYEINYNIKPEGDINDIVIENIPTFYILCGGFPCQPFSQAGKQKGFNDNRANVFYKICDIIQFHNPKYILLENVKTVKTHNKGKTWQTIKKI
jgi:DNA (cytosine-5)-methyltransferase 1